MDDTKLIVLYEDLLETIQSLNKEVPEVIDFYHKAKIELDQSLSVFQNTVAEAKDELSKAEASGLEKIISFSASRRKTIDDHVRSLNDAIKKASKIEKAIGISANYALQIESRLEQLNHHMTQLVDAIGEQENRLKDFDQRISSLEDRFVGGSVPLIIDYDEFASAIELFKKYNGRINRPIILEKQNYTNDYCFRVSGINEEAKVLLGRFYRQGKKYGEMSTFAFETKCRMFHGETLGDVIAGEI